MPNRLDESTVSSEILARYVIRRCFVQDIKDWHRLKQFVTILRTESRSRQVIGRADNPRLWLRHILDSAQLIFYIRENDLHIVDLGSGNGMPGLVLAILRPQLHVTLIDSNAGKCQFLLEAVKSLDLVNVDVVHERLRAGWRYGAGIRQRHRLKRADVLIARAVAPPHQCMRLLRPLSQKSSRYIFPCGQSWSAAVKDLDSIQGFQFTTKDSCTSDSSVILVGSFPSA